MKCGKPFDARLTDYIHVPCCSAWYVSASGERTKCLVENVDVSVRSCDMTTAHHRPSHSCIQGCST